MRRIEASRRNASAFRLRFSQSLASLRQRLSQAKVCSTTQSALCGAVTLDQTARCIDRARKHWDSVARRGGFDRGWVFRCQNTRHRYLVLDRCRNRCSNLGRDRRLLDRQAVRASAIDEIWHSPLTEERIRVGQWLFVRYGGRFVFIALFLPFLRNIAAVLAGTNSMAQHSFYFASATAAAAWIMGYGLAAYSFGEAFANLASPAAVVLGLAATLIVLATPVLILRYERPTPTPRFTARSSGVASMR
jgi:hypothetical protein